ncbi:MAG: indolepyruvate oxidoreductase subunit beta family protein, partial [Robiginitomaculum sp.]|nr:indolepyruvate oxidoreductase subunit beta family protein [Robiginitomaculum sp.]
MAKLSKDKPINIAIIAMGGQGGGVLSKWILDMAQAQGYLAQYTSVPGVAQRTGATIYYIELFPAHLADKQKQKPVLALTPIPEDVDIVIASEMMESGRALMRGFVSAGTTLIASDHRDYAITEKQEMGDGRRELSKVRSLSEKTAANYICFDMDKAAREAGSVISSVLFGALAGSDALPFECEVFEKTITESGRAVAANLRGFALGYENAQSKTKAQATPKPNKPGTPSPSVAPLLTRMKKDFPPHAHYMITEGLKKLVDYQDPAYAGLYLDRLGEFADMDSAKKDWRLTKDMARYLALAMSYEDTVRVADLKIRAARFERFRDEVKAADGQIVNVSEYMHPRLQEICDVLPAPIGRALLKMQFLNMFFKKGRRITTTNLTGFLLLSCVAKLKFMRRKSLRYALETARIEAWSVDVKTAAAHNYGLACELAGLQRLVKGYGDTHERGLGNVAKIMKAYPDFNMHEKAAGKLRTLKEAALKDEEGA